MRPPRIAILALLSAASLFLLCRTITSYRRPGPAVAPTTSPNSHFRSFLSFTAPFTLFPPNAAISLTDDNSTFFPARPAAFGPPLPSHGLSGQLWIGSGFGDDSLQDIDGSGELGCSDIPGWEDGRAMLALKPTSHDAAVHGKSGIGSTKAKSSKRDTDDMSGAFTDEDVKLNTKSGSKPGHIDDGTDDYLHERYQKSGLPNRDALMESTSHADIQSIQETAEITGKVVLLRRGGCGFLEKVKWAQRRGAAGVIVGDRHKGGPLIQMFARGDTSNVSIPAVFTAYTTAHLLSSLRQSGSFIQEVIEEDRNGALKMQPFDEPRKNRVMKQAAQVTATQAVSKPTATPNSQSQSAKRGTRASQKTSASGRTGLFAHLFGWGSRTDGGGEKSRPPSSGRLDWVLVDDWSEEKDKVIRTGLEKASKKGKKPKVDKPSGGPEDNFQIGIQDWRDPDLVGAVPEDTSAPPHDGSSKSSKSLSKSSGDTTDPSSRQTGKQVKDVNGPKGGSITPGSGEYAAKHAAATVEEGEAKRRSHGGIMSKIFGDDDGTDFSDPESLPGTVSASLEQEPQPGGGHHEGLWVTITPTSSASPFFDTLLVLVISPLITLSVVYALLIIRARIRRRRWRAPKSVVERLPVRTYHTIAPSPLMSPRLVSPNSSSPTTPLLQGSSAPRPRPRSRTTTGVPEADLLTVDAALQRVRSPSRMEPEAGSSHISSEWKKYMARQSECVVCLEEYIDGVSQVMSLPCGHEFHADCITPWLTTRRRTCPICKGDVVRSLARGSSSSPRYEPYQDDSDDTISRAPSRSGSTQSDGDADVEQGILSPSPQRIRRSQRPEGWFNVLSSGLGSGSSRSSWTASSDRSR